MIIGAIDYSKNSPGAVRAYINDETFEIEQLDYFGITTTKAKNPKSDAGKGCMRLYDKGLDDYAKINFMSENVLEFLEGCEYIALEGYAFGAKGKVFDIAEATGVLKWKIYQSGMKMRIYAPNLIKMFATEHGNADKDRMVETYMNVGNPLNLPKSQVSKHPFEDIIDAYWVLKLLHRELEIRKGFKKLHELSEVEIRPFNHISKGNPINLLSREFISKGK